MGYKTNGVTISHKAHLTFDLSRSKVMAPKESLYMISSMSTIQLKSLYLIVFEIFDKKACMTFDLGSGSKVMAPNESPYMISYVLNTNEVSISLSFLDI